MPYHLGVFRLGAPGDVKPQELFNRALEKIADVDDSELVNVLWRGEDEGQILIAGPADPDRGAAILRELGCEETSVLYTAAETQAGNARRPRGER